MQWAGRLWDSSGSLTARQPPLDRHLSLSIYTLHARPPLPLSNRPLPLALFGRDRRFRRR
jgi:hypothetical protein